VCFEVASGDGQTVTTYNILGVGALGGFYGARLAKGGADVRFLLHSDFDVVARDGLRVESKDGDCSIAHPEIYRSAADLPPADVSVVAMKSTSNALLGELLPPSVGHDGAVLVMQNGLGVERDAAEVVPGHSVLGGLAFLCSNKVGPGHIRHLDYGPVRLGEYREDGAAAGVSSLMNTVAADFERASIPVSMEADLVLARWLKLVWNIPYNGLCVVYGGNTDVVMAHPEARQRVEAIMHEVLAAAAACGREIGEGFVPAMLESTNAMASYAPSMKLDADAGRPLELDAIYARPLAAAAEHGVDCPEVSRLYEELKGRDAR
jgi:2-dehydropantoate 2-reductase